MSTIYWTCFLLLFTVGYCYENLCISKGPNTRASQSSTHENQVASKVIDGKSQNYGSCAETHADQLAPAWVKVDLGGIYSLSHVVIYYRTEINWKPYRFRQYYLEVSKTSHSPRIRCYTDTTPDSEIPNGTQNITCKEEARYVIVETNYDAPEDSARGPILEICEIEVYGCDIGRYGESCKYCSGCSTCDVNTGVCEIFTCSPNCVNVQCERNGNCTQGCIQGYWGDTCKNVCPSTCLMSGCNSTNGLCNSCSDGYYGDICEKQCYWPCYGRKCNKDYGYCTTGCDLGYYGKYCQERCGNCSTGTCDRDSGNCEACNTGYYGKNCDLKCSDTCFNKECRRKDGYCSIGCTSGFYGSFCHMSCSENCAQTKCSQNGTCIGGCKPNWTGDECDNCSPNHYGPRCDQQCSPICLNGTCFSNNGSCKDGCNINFSDSQRIQVINQSSESKSNTEVYSALYSVIAILFISIFLNIFLIVRSVRQTIDNKQNSKKVNSHKKTTQYANTTISDGVEENAGYQELGELSQPSHYDDLK